MLQRTEGELSSTDMVEALAAAEKPRRRPGRVSAYDGSFTSSRALVVVSAGPPGAGKSAIDAFPEFVLYRAIDADDFEDAPIVRAEADRLLDRWLETILPDGEPVSLREPATFVHAEPTVVAARYRDTALDRGENLLVHGTLRGRTGRRPVR